MSKAITRRDVITRNKQLALHEATGLIDERSNALGGTSFRQQRDLIKESGVPLNITYDQYFWKFVRQDIASRIVSAAADATWSSINNEPPFELLDGQGDDASSSSAFVETWRQLAQGESDFNELIDKKSLYHFLHRGDVISGIGKYGIILLGIDDGKPLSEPLDANSASELLYVNTFPENDAAVTDIEEDSTQRRFGLPLSYSINIPTVSNSSDATPKTVSFSRVIHVAENLINNDTIGRPRLEKVFNRLEDIEKVLVASGESAWKLFDKGTIFSTKEGWEAPDDEITEAKMDQFAHGLRRSLLLEGIDIDVLGGEIVDPSNLIDTYLSFISGSTGIPKRILIGAERGELASSQDESNWISRISERQTSFAEPIILRPFINRLIFSGILPKPSSGSYSIKWNSLFQLSELQQSELAKNKAQAAFVAGNAVSSGKIVTKEEARIEILGLTAEPEIGEYEEPTAFIELPPVTNLDKSLAANQDEAFEHSAMIMTDKATENIAKVYENWVVALEHEILTSRNPEQAVSGMIQTLQRRISEMMVASIIEFSGEEDLTNSQVTAMLNRVDATLEVFNESTLPAITEKALELANDSDVEFTSNESFRDLMRSLISRVKMAASSLWSAAWDAWRQPLTLNQIVEWVGPDDEFSCTPCGLQMRLGPRPLFEVPTPGPDVCEGLTNCRHSIRRVE